MPGWAIVAIVAIVMLTIVQVVAMITRRPLPGTQDPAELEELQKRIEALETHRPEIEAEPTIPTKAEANLAAEDRWRLDMLEARLEELEKKRDDGASPA